MLDKFAKGFISDSLGLSDIGVIVEPKDYNQTQSDDFLLHNERIYFLIKTKSDEYCFTNLALIHVDGTSAVSSKKTLKRYDYVLHDIVNIELETAGTIDLDVELTFYINSQRFHISIKKQYIESARDIYQALKAMELEKFEHSHNYNKLMSNLQLVTEQVGASARFETPAQSLELFNGLLEETEKRYKKIKHDYFVKDFGYLFEHYINN